MIKLSDAYVGQRVEYNGCKSIGKCTGIIKKIIHLDPEDPPYWIGFAIVSVEELPEVWPYSDNDFAPTLLHLVPVKEN